MIINIVLTKVMLRINLTARGGGGGGGGVVAPPKRKKPTPPKFSVDVHSFLAQILRQV